MRFASAERYRNVEEVRNAYPGTTRIVEVEGGWIVFAPEAAFERARRQRQARAQGSGFGSADADLHRHRCRGQRGPMRLSG
jgi:hypothetical protein